MIGAMVGVREGTHFDVDVWPRARAARRGAAARSSPACFVLVVRAGVRLVRHRVHAASPGTGPPSWPSCRSGCIHVAWPVAGVTWVLFLGEQFVDDLRVLLDRRDAAHERRRRCSTPGVAALILFGVFFTLMVLRVPVAFALGLACLPILLIEPRLSPMTLMQETFNAYNSFILLAVPFFLLTANLMNVGGITDRLVRLSRDAGRALPRRPGADQRRAVDLLRRHLRLVDRRCGEPVQDLHRGAEQGRLRPVASRSRSPRCRRCWR